jgi:hypothetical protein
MNWAHFARTPGLDSAHEDINVPALPDLAQMSVQVS